MDESIPRTGIDVECTDELEYCYILTSDGILVLPMHPPTKLHSELI